MYLIVNEGYDAMRCGETERVLERGTGGEEFFKLVCSFVGPNTSSCLAEAVEDCDRLRSLSGNGHIVVYRCEPVPAMEYEQAFKEFYRRKLATLEEQEGTSCSCNSREGGAALQGVHNPNR